MARQEIEIPVYIFMGFLDSGKTTFVKETLLDREFTGGAKTLLLVCEEGEEEYDEKRPETQEYLHGNDRRGTAEYRTSAGFAG